MPTTRSSSYEPSKFEVPTPQARAYHSDGQVVLVSFTSPTWWGAMTNYHTRHSVPQFNYDPRGVVRQGLYCDLLKTAQQQTNYTLTAEVEIAMEEVYNWSRLKHMAGLREFDRNAQGLRPVFDPAWIPASQIPEEAKVECRKKAIEFCQ